jgi:predicted DNA-binding transcriptional regulator YafY
MDTRTSALPCDTTRTGSGAHFKVVYDSVRPGISERVIYPFGVYASQGFWYCFCHDYRREENFFLRADRSREVEPIEGFERPPHVPSSDWDARSRAEEVRCSRWGRTSASEERRTSGYLLYLARSRGNSTGWVS